MKYKLNGTLLTELRTILGFTKQTLVMKTGIDKSKWNRKQDSSDWSIHDLLQIANSLHIPVSCFISTDGADRIGNKDDYLMRPARYKDCYWKPETVDAIFGSDSPEKIKWQEIGRVMNVDDETMSNRMRPKSGKFSALTAHFLCDVCNTLQLNLGDFIASPNRPIPPLYPALNLATLRDNLKELTERERDTEEMAERIRRLEQEMRELKAIVRQLQQQKVRTIQYDTDDATREYPLVAENALSPNGAPGGNMA